MMIGTIGYHIKSEHRNMINSQFTTPFYFQQSRILN